MCCVPSRSLIEWWSPHHVSFKISATELLWLGRDNVLRIINRPGVAGALLQTPLWTIKSVRQWAFSFKSSKYHKSQTLRARNLKFWGNIHPHNMSHGTCHVSCVICHMSHFACYVSYVTCIYLLLLLNINSKKISTRTKYQQGLLLNYEKSLKQPNLKKDQVSTTIKSQQPPKLP